METLAIHNICDKMQNQVNSPTVLQNWRLCWGTTKRGVTLELDHLKNFDLFALHLGFARVLLCCKNSTPRFGDLR